MYVCMYVCYADKPETIEHLKAKFAFNKMVQLDIHLTAQSFYCVERLMAVKINRNGDVNWPPRSSNLTLLDYYLWGAVKDKCYADKPETIEALRANIREAIGEIQLHTMDNVLKNWTDCAGYCMASRGSHLNEIIFHY